MEEPGERTLKRPADSQSPEDESEGSGAQAPKRPALSGFSFRPSPLQKATQGLILRQSSLATCTPSSTAAADKSNSSAGTSQVGFLRLDNSELKPIGVSSTSGSPATTNGKDSTNHVDSTTGSFSTFIQSANAVQTFSSLSSSSSITGFASEGGLREESKGEEGREGDGEGTEAGRRGSGEEAGESKTGAMGSASVSLPEVQRVTGEEGEKKIVQVNARLYAFDAATHSWKERGRGDIRLNDACQSEGVFQSRLVMRASGSYRVLFNTHLWAEMKCEKANQKTIRITAQDRDSIAVFLITGSAKDMQQLFNSIDHRIEALKLNAKHASSKTDEEKEAQLRVSRESSAFDEEDKESVQEDVPSSPESSVETHTADIRQKAVSLPSSADDSGSGCEREEEREGEGGEGLRESEAGSNTSLQQSVDSEPSSTPPDNK